MGNSDSSESNPIYLRLTQPIQARRTSLQERWAIFTPPGVMLIISVVFLPIMTGDALLGALALIILCLGLMPAAVGAASAILTYQEMQGEHFALIVMTALQNDQIIDGLKRGVLLRVRPLRTAAISLAISIFAVPLCAGPLILAIARTSSPLTTMLDFIAPWYCAGIIIVGFIALYAYVIVLYFSDAAVSVGIAAGLRYREGSLATAISASSGLIVAVEAAGPLVLAAGFIMLIPGSVGQMVGAMLLILVLALLPVFVPAGLTQLANWWITRYLNQIRASGGKP